MLPKKSSQFLRQNSFDEKEIKKNYASITLSHEESSSKFSSPRIKSSRLLYKKRRRLSNSSFRANNANNSSKNCVKFSEDTKNIKCDIINLHQIRGQNDISNGGVLLSPKSPKRKISDIVEQYKMHPFRKLNLQIIQEEIKQKICEMHQKSILFDEEKKNYNLSTISSPNVGTKKIRKSMVETFGLEEGHYKKNNKLSSIVNTIKFVNLSSSNIEENEDNKKNTNVNDDLPFSTIISLNPIQSPRKKNNLKKTTIINKKFNTTIEIKNRNLEKKKNIYDSMEDNESEEEYEQDGKLSPTSNFILIFDSFILFFFFYESFLFPITIAKIKCYCKNLDNNSFDNFNEYIYYFIDFLFLLDCIISFFRGYYSTSYVLIQNQLLIIKNYLQTDFILDLIEAIPFYSLSKYLCFFKKKETICYQYSMPIIYIVLNLLSLLKMLKIIKINRPKKNMSLDYIYGLVSDNYDAERFIQSFIDVLIFFAIFNIFICVNMFIEKYSDIIARDESLFYSYINSFYFLMTTLTTVGYGDQVSQTIPARLFHIIFLTLGSVAYSYIISSIGNFFQNDSHAKIQLNDDLSLLENLRVHYPNLKYKLYTNIQKFLQKKSNRLKKYDDNVLVSTLPYTLKHSILFTMYKTVVENFNFFKNNHNSAFILQVLTNFIPGIYKKNEFLIYEGDLLEEMIFVKDGRLSLDAAINTENPTKSIMKYINENFNTFTAEEELKILGKFEINEKNTKSNNLNLLNRSISINYVKTKINNAFKSNAFNSQDNIASSISIKKENNNEHNDQNYFYNYILNGGAIRNEEGNYQYIKILDIRKHEHFGCVFMTLKKPSPLSLQVRSKFAELFLLKKKDAVTISKNYPNIWKKLYIKEFHNLISIKNLTFKSLKKYISVNELLLTTNINIDDCLTNNMSYNNDMNMEELERSILADRTISSKKIYKRLHTPKSLIKSNENSSNLSPLKKKTNQRNVLSDINKSLSKIENYKIKDQMDSHSEAPFYRPNFNKLFFTSTYKSGDSNINPKMSTFQRKLSPQHHRILTSLSLISKKNFNQQKKNKFKDNKLNMILTTYINRLNYLKKAYRKRGRLSEGEIKNTKDLYAKLRNSLKLHDKNMEILNNIDSSTIMDEIQKICLSEKKLSIFNSESSYKVFDSCNFIITHESNFKIEESYQNINKIVNGEYINDLVCQESTKEFLKRYYKIENTVIINEKKNKSSSEFSSDIKNKENFIDIKLSKIYNENEVQKNSIFLYEKETPKFRDNSYRSKSSGSKKVCFSLSQNSFYKRSNTPNKNIDIKNKNISLPNIKNPKNIKIFNETEVEYEIEKNYNKNSSSVNNKTTSRKNWKKSSQSLFNHKSFKIKNKNKNNIINQIFEFKIPHSNIIVNNITQSKPNNFANSENDKEICSTLNHMLKAKTNSKNNISVLNYPNNERENKMKSENAKCVVF